MELSSLLNWFSSILSGSWWIPAILFVGWLISQLIDNRLQAKKEAQINTLRKRGVIAPAVVVSAVKGTTRSPFGREEMKIIYEVDVQPEGNSAFRTTFKTWVTKRNYTAVFNRLIDEEGRKIWVTYDPNDTKQMIFEYYDSEREEILTKRALSDRRAAFEKAEKLNETLRKKGEESLATILESEDLGLAYKSDNAKAMRFKFEVTPKSGAQFHADSSAMIGNAALEKYSVGKKIYVKFDPREPGRVAVERSA